MWTMAEGKAPQANSVALQCSDTPVAITSRASLLQLSTGHPVYCAAERVGPR